MTLSPAEMALLGQFWAQILQFWQKLCRPKSTGRSGTIGIWVSTAAALKPSPRYGFSIIPARLTSPMPEAINSGGNNTEYRFTNEGPYWADASQPSRLT